MLKRYFAFVLILFYSLISYAQSGEIIKGKVINKKSGEPVGFAAVQIVESESWTATDENGNFSFRNVQLQSFSLQVQCLGMEPFTIIKQLKDFQNKELVFEMVPVSFDMEEVTVLAKKGNGITTTTTIGNAAIEHVQPTSLADIMQLLPGNVVTSNPNLSNAQQVSIREIGSDANSAMGTAILVDGAPVSNDANLQTFSTSKSGNNFSSVAGAGVDLRQISTDNIESVEVIKGIPSVAYGDLTSGAVILKTKAGYSPYAIKIKTDPKIKQVTLGKGYKYEKIGGAVNFNLDYLQSFSDLRSKFEGYDRFTGEIGLSSVINKSMKPLTLNAKVAYFSTLDEEKTDPDALVSEERIFSNDQGFRFNLNGKWLLKQKLITNLDYTFSVNYTHQTSYQEKYRTSQGIETISTSLYEGENIGLFLPTEQFTTYKIDGKPVSIFFQLTGNKFINLKKGSINKILYGFEYRLNGNNGEGQIYDITNPPFISSYTSRPRKFMDIPALTNISYYLEDKLFLTIGKTYLDIQAGIRLNNFQSKGLFKSQLGYFTEPRFNIQYNFLNSKNNKLFDKLAFHFGIGKTYKSPSLLYLYPNKAYFDLSVLNYYTGNQNLDLAVINTHIYETENPELKPSENLKLELGLDFKVKSVIGNLTFFKENLTNGFNFDPEYLFIPSYKYSAGDIPAGEKPNLDILPKVPSIAVTGYQMPVNNSESEKKGIEYSFDFGKIRALYTSFTLDGAWLRTKRIYSTIPYQNHPSSSNSSPYLYVGVYPAGESKIGEQLNSSLRMVTQIPKLRIILSSTAQMIWYDKYFYPEYDEAPIYLIYPDGTTKTFTSDMRKDPDYIRFVNEKSDQYYQKEIMSPLLLTNFRLSKEISNTVKLSFYVNNFVNYRPMYEYTRSGSFVRRNPSVYFGAELKIKL
ncbi:MAG: TonB-dependent receptor [Prolixibacteraceae bacterium]